MIFKLPKIDITLGKDDTIMLDSTELDQGFPVPLPTKRIENNCRQDIHGRNKQSKHASNTFPSHTPPTAAKTRQRKS